MIGLHLAGMAAAIAGTLLGISAPVMAATPLQSAAQAKIVCRETIPVGTILRRSIVCMSEAAWNKSISDRDDKEDYTREWLKLKQPTDGNTVQIGTANWDKLPQLKREGKLPYIQLVSQVQQFLRGGGCSFPGQTAKAFDISVHYGVMLDSNGRASRVLVEDTKCPLLNALVGLSALARSNRGDFASADNLPSRWLGDRMSYTLQ
jgi:hypothetical protein